MMQPVESQPPRTQGHTLQRRLGLFDAVVVGLAAMVGAGVFAAYGPAAAAAGTWLPLALGLAAVVAYCNATSSARLAALYPQSGGTYVYGRERLGEFWGYLAGWCFVIGKTASCAAMALTVGSYAWPEQAHPIAVLAVAAVVAIDCAGIEKSAQASRVIVGVVLSVLIGFVLVALLAPLRPRLTAPVGGAPSAYGIGQAAGLLFFAFAGYARLATLGEEVRDPRRTIPRAIPVALGLALLVYAGVAAALLRTLGADGIAAATSPLAAAAARLPWAPVGGILRVTAVLAAFGSLLSLLLGVSRTTLAMARDGHLPAHLARLSGRRVPHVAAVSVGVIAAVAAGLLDVRGMIGFSSTAVLTYYAIANAAALTLRRDEGAAPRAVGVLGLIGCLALAACLPWASLTGGAVLIALGAGAYAVRPRLAR